MTDREELDIYRRFFSRLSIGLATFDTEFIRECLVMVRNWGYAHSNSTLDSEHDEKYRLASIKRMSKIDKK